MVSLYIIYPRISTCYLPGWRTGNARWKVASLYRTLRADGYMTTQLWKSLFHLKRASRKVCRIFGDVNIQALRAQSKTHPNPRNNSTTQISHLSQAAFGTCRSIDHKSIGSIDLKTQNMFNNVQTCSKIFKRITGVQLNSLNDWMIWNHWPHGWPATMICRATKIRWPSKPSRFGSGHENFIAQAA